MPAYKNLGHIKNAIHIEEKIFQSFVPPYGNESPVLVYGNNEAGSFAGLLSSRGNKSVYLLDSYYDFVWSGFNVESCKNAEKYLTDHDGLY